MTRFACSPDSTSSKENRRPRPVVEKCSNAPVFRRRMVIPLGESKSVNQPQAPGASKPEKGRNGKRRLLKSQSPASKVLSSHGSGLSHDQVLSSLGQKSDCRSSAGRYASCSPQKTHEISLASVQSEHRKEMRSPGQNSEAIQVNENCRPDGTPPLRSTSSPDVITRSSTTSETPRMQDRLVMAPDGVTMVKDGRSCKPRGMLMGNSGFKCGNSGELEQIPDPSGACVEWVDTTLDSASSYSQFCDTGLQHLSSMMDSKSTDNCLHDITKDIYNDDASPSESTWLVNTGTWLSPEPFSAFGLQNPESRIGSHSPVSSDYVRPCPPSTQIGVTESFGARRKILVDCDFSQRSEFPPIKRTYDDHNVFSSSLGQQPRNQQITFVNHDVPRGRGIGDFSFDEEADGLVGSICEDEHESVASGCQSDVEVHIQAIGNFPSSSGLMTKEALGLDFAADGNRSSSSGPMTIEASPRKYPGKVEAMKTSLYNSLCSSPLAEFASPRADKGVHFLPSSGVGTAILRDAFLDSCEPLLGNREGDLSEEQDISGMHLSSEVMVAETLYEIALEKLRRTRDKARARFATGDQTPRSSGKQSPYIPTVRRAGIEGNSTETTPNVQKSCIVDPVVNCTPDPPSAERIQSPKKLVRDQSEANVLQGNLSYGAEVAQPACPDHSSRLLHREIQPHCSSQATTKALCCRPVPANQPKRRTSCQRFICKYVGCGNPLGAALAIGFLVISLAIRCFIYSRPKHFPLPPC